MTEETKAIEKTTKSHVLLQHTPQLLLDEATNAARVLQGVISAKPDKVMMGGKQYLEYEDWSLLGRFYGITARSVGEPEHVQLGPGIAGFKATSEAVDREGRILSRASAYCLSDEEKWGTRTKYAYAYAVRSGGWSETDPGPTNIVWIDNPNKPGKKMPKKERRIVGKEQVPLFQLASMAQTRANAKVLRNVLSWVVVLAGYGTTPAEEIEHMVRPTRDEPEPVDAEPVNNSNPGEAPNELEPGTDAEVMETEPIEPLKLRTPPDGHKDWKSPLALANECIRLRGGDEQAGRELFQEVTGSSTARRMQPSTVLQGWGRLEDLQVEGNL
jgi:hypothetical protein